MTPCVASWLGDMQRTKKMNRMIEAFAELNKKRHIFLQTEENSKSLARAVSADGRCERRWFYALAVATAAAGTAGGHPTSEFIGSSGFDKLAQFSVRTQTVKAIL